MISLNLLFIAKKAFPNIPTIFVSLIFLEVGQSCLPSDLRHNRHLKSALAEHSHHTSHHICLENDRIIAKIGNYTKRKVRERIEIELTLENLNRDEGGKLSETWKPVVQILQASCQQNSSRE